MFAPDTSVTAETTEPFSRDHLNVAVVSSPPWWISTRYSWFSRPRYPAGGVGSQVQSAALPLVCALSLPPSGICPVWYNCAQQSCSTPLGTDGTGSGTVPTADPG